MSNSFKLCPIHFPGGGGEKLAVGASPPFRPLATGLLPRFIEITLQLIHCAR